MDLEVAIIRLLGANAGVSALVDDRITAGVLPNPTEYGAMVYQPGGRTFVEVLDVDGVSLVTERFVVKSAFKGAGVTGFSDASAIDHAGYLALHEFRGAVTDGASPPASLEIQRIVAMEGAHQYLWDADTKTHNFITEFEATYLENPAVDP